MKIQGMYAAVATPFDHTGAMYRVKVQHNFEKWSRTSLAGFVVGSLTGEGPLLDAEEKIELLRLAARRCRKAAPSSPMSAGKASMPRRIWRARAAQAGAHAVVSTVPHQYRNLMYGPETQMLFFRALADQSPVPVLIHNAPQMTGVDLLPETMANLAEHPNIAGVIETGTPASRVGADSRSSHPKDFRRPRRYRVAGLGIAQGGANGAALAFASAAPYATIAIWEAFRTREEEAGLDWQGRISHPSILVTDMYGVPGLKHAMDLNGYYGGPPRLPFVPVSQDARREIEEAFRDLKG